MHATRSTAARLLLALLVALALAGSASAKTPPDELPAPPLPPVVPCGCL